jgi:hypothetical protein
VCLQALVPILFSTLLHLGLHTPHTFAIGGYPSVARRSASDTRRNILISSPTQTSQEEGANSKQAFLRLRPREDPRRKRSLLRAEASAGLEKYFARAAHAEVRGLCLYGTCFPTAATERSSATNGITVDKALKNERVCTHR